VKIGNSKFNPMNEKIENYWRTYQEINSWIIYSDTKAGILVTVYGVLLTIIYTNSNNLYAAISSSVIILLLTILCALFSILSLFFAFKCLNPQLKNDNPKSVLYFGHIATNKNYKDYLKYSDKIFSDKKSTIEHLSEQVYVNSKIAWGKFSYVTISIRFFFASMAVLILMLTIYFFKK